jgi:large conductance mechanosensitive channel
LSKLAKTVIIKEKEDFMKKILNEFKDFIARGNVIDLAVGVIVGSAFGKIVTSLVSDILMPIIGVILGGIDFTNLTIKFNDATIYYGNFIQNIVDFLIVAFCIFMFVKAINALTSKTKKKEVKEEPKKSDEVILLEEIRDLLKKKNK